MAAIASTLPLDRLDRAFSPYLARRSHRSHRIEAIDNRRFPCTVSTH
ncbi:hypothetical protein JJD41_12745 [Oxynema sp. CENA135]|nr:hypothetical protein [Oxynema sp. CENA135]MBK4730725.1 hypothetical protein [Oxynema sp. CENA135]